MTFRAIYFGTPEIAVPALRALAQIADVRLVVCQPDKPSGRGLALTSPPVKQCAVELGLPILQPTKVRTPEFAASIRDQGADIAVVMAYGRILTKDVLAAPRLGCVNLHASLLPKYRGAAPITWSIVQGERETGISLMQMDEGLDTGPVLTMHSIPIGDDMTAGDLSVALGKLAAEVVTGQLPRVVAGELRAVPQENSQATHARLLTKNDGLIDFNQPAQRVHDHIRGMSPWPSAFSRIDGKLFKIHRASVSAASSPENAPGTILVAEKDNIEVACGQGSIAILTGQLEGKKSLSARDLIAGRVIQTGQNLRP
jgi:methionyl-tRNA formyltransferase